MDAKKWPLGASSCSTGSIDRSVFLAYAKAGIDLIEISLPWQKYPDIDWRETGKNAEESGVGLWSLHLPFSPFETNDIASLDPGVRKSTVLAQLEYIKRAAEAGIKIAVVHPSAEPIPDGQRGEKIKIARESLAGLAEQADIYGVQIAVENLPRTCLGNCSGEIKALIGADERLRVCFDTNHQLIEKNIDFVRALGGKIITVHISDYDFLNERHWLPYEGKTDWPELVGGLESAGYRGPFMYEVGLSPPASIRRRMLSLDDFRRNYEACVNKRPAEKIGVPDTEACAKNAYFQVPMI